VDRFGRAGGEQRVVDAEGIGHAHDACDARSADAASTSAGFRS
jgi:hypothetical protein